MPLQPAAQLSSHLFSYFLLCFLLAAAWLSSYILYFLYGSIYAAVACDAVQLARLNEAIILANIGSRNCHHIQRSEELLQHISVQWNVTKQRSDSDNFQNREEIVTLAVYVAVIEALPPFMSGH